MKKYVFILLLIAEALFAQGQCLTTSIIVNTGYDPVSGLALPVGVSGSTPVPDAKWIVTAETPGIAAALPLTLPLLPAGSTLTEVTPGGLADIITPAPGGWAFNPPGQPGGWISCLNSTIRYTDFTTVYEQTLGRPFRLCAPDNITIDIYIANDDWITSSNIDGTIPLSFSQPAVPNNSNYSTFTHFTQTVSLSCGVHLVNFVVHDYNWNPYRPSNASGLDVYGTFSSATGTASIISETNPSCSSYVCNVSATTSKDTTVCSGTSITLFSDSLNNNLWSNMATTSSITVTSSGTYWVRTATGPCSYRTDTTHVIFGSVFTVNLGDDTSFCIGNSITLDPVIPPGSTLTWSTGATGPSISVNSSGTYWVSVTDGGCSNRDSIDVAVHPIPVVELGPDQSLCTGTPLTLQSAYTYTTPGYLWSTGSTAASISPAASGSYWLQVTEAGCSGADTVNVDFRPSPIVAIGKDRNICPGTSVMLGSPEPGGVQYLWNTGSTDSALSVTDAGTYTLTVDLNGCKTSATINITATPAESANLGPDTSLCIGNAIMLSVNSSYALWSNYHVGPSINVTETGTYWVIIRGLCDTVSDTINVDYHICDIGFPSAFTPNGDGLNDFIGVVGTLKYYSDFSLDIYNRWGQRVFYTQDIYKGWDGTYNGTKQDLGTYFYLMYYRLEGKQHMMRGDFQLVR